MDAGGAGGRQIPDGSMQNAVSRYPRRKPGGYRCKLEQPVEPNPDYLGKRVSVKWDGLEDWQDGKVFAYNNENCKHVIDYDEPNDQEAEFRMGLDAKVRLDLPQGQEPREASQAHLENLMRLLQAEETELSDCAEALSAQLAKTQRKLVDKRVQIGRVSQMMEDIGKEQQAAATAAAADAVSAMQKLPPDCPVMRRVGDNLQKKWRQSPPTEVPLQDSLAPPAQQVQQQEHQEQQQQCLDGVEADGEDFPQRKRQRQGPAGTLNSVAGLQQQQQQQRPAAGSAHIAGGDIKLGCSKCKFSERGCKRCRERAAQQAKTHQRQQQHDEADVQQQQQQQHGEANMQQQQHDDADMQQQLLHDEADLQQQQQQQHDDTNMQQQQQDNEANMQFAIAKHSRTRMKRVSALHSPSKVLSRAAAAAAPAPGPAPVAVQPAQAAASSAPGLRQQKQCHRSPLRPLIVGEPQQQQQQQLSEPTKPKPSLGSSQVLQEGSSSGSGSRRHRHDRLLRGAANAQQGGLKPAGVPQQEQHTSRQCSHQEQECEEQAPVVRASNIPLELHRLSMAPRDQSRIKSAQATSSQTSQQQEQQQQRCKLRRDAAQQSSQQCKQQQDAHASMPQQEAQQEAKQQQQHAQEQQLCDGAFVAGPGLQQEQEQQQQQELKAKSKKLGRELQNLLLEAALEAERPSSGSRSSSRSSARARHVDGPAALQGPSPAAAAAPSEGAAAARAPVDAGEVAAAPAAASAAEMLALAAPPAPIAGAAAPAPAPTAAVTVAAAAQVPAAGDASKHTSQQGSKPAARKLKEGITRLMLNTSKANQQEQDTQQQMPEQQGRMPSLQAAQQPQQPQEQPEASQQQGHNQHVLSRLQEAGHLAVQQQSRVQAQQEGCQAAGDAAASRLATAAAADSSIEQQQQQRQRPRSSTAPLRSSTRSAATPQAPAAAAAAQSAQRGTPATARPAGTGTGPSGGAGGGSGAAGGGGSEGATFVANKAAQAAANALTKGGQVNPVNLPGLEFTSVEWVMQQLGPCMLLPEAQQKLDALPQQGTGQPARLDLLSLDQMLEDAYHEHMQSRETHALFKEMDVSMRLSPEALVGRQLRVYWEQDDAWFAGSVEAWDPKTAKHKVVYEDGDVASMWMGVERTRLLITAGEELQRPDAATLQMLSNRYMEQARLVEQSLARSNKGSSDESEDLKETAKKLRAKAQVLLGAAYVKAREPPPDCWLVKGPAAVGGSGGSSKHRKRKSSSAPASRGATPAAGADADAGAGLAGQLDDEAAGGVLQPAEASRQQPQQQDQQQQQGPQQQDQQAMEQQAMDVDVPSPAAAAGDQGDEDATGRYAKRMRLSRSQQAAQPRPSAAAAAAGGTPMRKHVLQKQASKHPTPSHASTAAAAQDAAGCSREQSPAADAAEERAQDGSSGGSGDGSSTVKFSVLSGEVVWVQIKGNAPWPALVITAEEDADFSVDIKGPSQRGAQVPVHIFGDYTRMYVSASCIIPTSVALRQRVWLPTVLNSSKQPAWVRMVQLYTNGLREFSTYCKTGELPDSEMVPEHNDERWLLEDREAEQQAAASAQDAAAAAGGAAKMKRKPTTGTQAPGDMELDELLKWAGCFVAAVCGVPGGHTSSSKSNGSGGPKLPLQLANNLLLTALGRVDYVHPRFHNDKFIFPVGFTVMRRARTPLSGDREVWHTAEILEGPQGAGPIFSVTPDGSAAVTGTTPTAAWQELYKAAASTDTGISSKASAAAITARAASVCGPRLFGLQHPVVAALIQSLPDAARCDGFFAWKGPAPPTQAPTPELQLARRVISAHLSKLPPGITPQHISRRGIALCDSCGEFAEADGNHFVECDGCGLLVHMHCYGVHSHPHGESWLCDVCALPDLTQPPACTLCPCVGGAMKVTSEGGWCHLLCATWVPGCAVGDGARMEPITGTQRCLTKERLKLVCSICAQPHGACIQCADKRCVKAFHATCARGAGYPMVMLDDSDSEDESENEQQQQQQQGPQQQQQQQQQQTDAGASGQQEQQQQPGAAAGAAVRKSGGKGRGGKGRRSHKPKAGTAAGDMCRLVTFCPKHRTQAETLPGARLHNLGPVLPAEASSMPQHSGSTARGTAGTVAGAGRDNQPEVTSPAKGGAADATAQPPAASGRALAFSNKRSNGSSNGRGAATAAAAVAAGALLGSVPPRQGVMLFGDSIQAPPGTCARSRPADMSTRRHLRAPDYAAVAQRKRLYMQALPHLVTGACGTVQQLLPAPVSLARCIGPEFEQHEQQQGVAAGSSRRQQPGAAAGDSSAAAAGAASGVLQLLHGRLPALGSKAAAAPVPQAVAAPQGAVRLSQGDRYRQMLASVNDRLCSGKSAIHGLGVFTKRAHKAGDYLIEYVGQLVRPVVTDHLEKTTYNSMVGSGTYIFDLNMTASVDATRAGNMAHLINHSCGPCAHSRTITVREVETGEPVDHVVIIASRDLPPGEELTYDYRFAGQDKLRCNCGAPSCRGWVNAPAAADAGAPRQRPDGSILLPRCDVEFLQGAAAAAAVTAAAAAAPAKKQAQV